jgi:UDP-N-acetylmuramate-alanine ligase
MATVKSKKKTAAPKVMRLTITPEMQEVLDLMKLDFPVLSEPELFKVLLSQFYNSVYGGKKTKTTTGSALKSLTAAVSSNAKDNTLTDNEQQKIWQDYKNSFR